MHQYVCTFITFHHMFLPFKIQVFSSWSEICVLYFLFEKLTHSFIRPFLFNSSSVDLIVVLADDSNTAQTVIELGAVFEVGLVGWRKPQKSSSFIKAAYQILIYNRLNGHTTII